MKKTRVTLNDVAAQAGTSATTASLVLGGQKVRHRISEETCQRIVEAAKRLDYVPNRLVHSMQQGSTQILSFFDGFRNRRANDLYRDRLTTAIEKAAGRHGYDILINCDFNRSPEEMYRYLNGGIVDGVLLFGPITDDPLLPYLRTSRLPTVLLGAEDEEGVISSVRDDVAMGMQQIADRLYDLGHRRILIPLESHEINKDAHERNTLLRKFLEAKGVRVPNCVVPSNPDGSDTILDYITGSSVQPTAVFCWRDFKAYYLLENCERHGIRIPAQFSIIGYDGLAWPLATSHRAASVSVDFDLLTETAIQLLIAKIHHPDQKVTQKRIPVTLHDGTTLAPPHHS